MRRTTRRWFYLALVLIGIASVIEVWFSDGAQIFSSFLNGMAIGYGSAALVYED